MATPDQRRGFLTFARLTAARQQPVKKQGTLAITNSRPVCESACYVKEESFCLPCCPMEELQAVAAITVPRRAATAFAMDSGADGCIVAPEDRSIQHQLPREQCNIELTVVGSTALSCGLTGILAESISMRTIYLAIGVGGAICGMLGFSARELARTR